VSAQLIGLGILIGGASARMGQDKASLKLANGLSLLEHIVQRLAGVKAELVFSSGVSPAELANDLLAIKDIFDMRLGPVGGIISSALWLSEHYPQLTACYFVSVDLAALNPETLQQLATNSHQISHFTDHPLPLYLALNSTTVQICHDLIPVIQKQGGMSVYQFIQHFAMRQEINCAAPENLNNLNYFWQWEQFIHENSI
jgi:molybdopterin-guanine dinucleotide biosynthesis protein A